MRSSNPVLTRLSRAADAAESALLAQDFTIAGAASKTLVLLVVVVFGATFPWNAAMAGDMATVQTTMMGGLIGGLVLGLATAFVPRIAPYTAPFYAIFQGLLLGSLSAIFELRYPGIVMQAVGVTLAVAVAMCLAYVFRIIRATARFRAMVVGATLGLCLHAMVGLVAHWGFGTTLPTMTTNSPLGLGIAVFAAGIAALNLVLDFALIEEAAGKAPKRFEWYAAFGLVVTLVWLYLEILRILGRARR